MKIALISPPWLPVPPPGYGGIEQVVAHLADGLERKGHKVIVYATGDSTVRADLRYFYKKGLGKDVLLEKSNIYFLLNQLHFALSDLPKNIDIIHNHCEYAGMHLLDGYPLPFLHTLHGAFYKNFDVSRHSLDDTTRAIRETLHFFKQHNFVSISNAQRQGMKDLQYVQTIYNSVDTTHLLFHERPGDAMCWLGRYSPLKGLDIAVKVAKLCKQKLIISASVHSARLADFKNKILSQVNGINIVYKGETVGIRAKQELLGKSKAFLFPLQWEEPFGIVMAEAMACGTPVIAYARGSAPEVVKDGETGFLVNPSPTDIRGKFITKSAGIAGLVEAVGRLYAMPEKEYLQMRRRCRSHVENNFTVEIMVDKYEKTYQKILN